MNNIKYASQSEPFKIMKKHFKTKKDKEYITSIYKIIKKSNPTITDKEIVSMCSKISKGGCTYASMANAIMEQVGDLNYLEEKLGYSFTNSEGIIEYDKLMIDIYSSLVSMVEIEVFKYDIRYYFSIKEAYESIVNKPFDNTIDALNELHNIGFLMEGNNEEGKIIFKNFKNPKKQKILGTYQEIAYNLFNINNPNITKDELEKLLKEYDYNYNIKYETDHSKFSGLGPVQINNKKKWLDKFMKINNLNFDVDIENVNYTENYNNFTNKLNEMLINNYSLLVSVGPNADCWMTDGKSWEKPNTNKFGHTMNFNGLDDDGNILLCSWGKIYKVPKEFYSKLEFVAIKTNAKTNNKTR